jgi:hypothetical protein
MKALLVILVLLLASGLCASASQLSVCAALDTTLGLRAGVEYSFHPRMGVKADLGASIFGMFLADAFYVFYLLPDRRRLQVDLLVGVPTVAMTMTFAGAMISLGASLKAGWPLGGAFSLELRVGGGFPLFFEPGKETVRPVRFPWFIPRLWPDLALGIRYALPGR